jgi:hypothetical protein
MARAKKVIAETTVTETEVVTAKPEAVVSEKDQIIAWLRSGNMAMFERSTRWLADRIEAGEHLQ